MKRFLSLALLLIVSHYSFCQRIYHQHQYSYDDYMAKSQRLKRGAWILLGTGIACTVIGSVLIVNGENNNNNNNYYYYDNSLTAQEVGGAILVYVGVLSSLGSIPMFIVSHVYRKKAMRASAFLDMQNVPNIKMTGVPLQPFPALGIKLNL